MGRGRAKAKQTKVARALKYGGPQTDFDRLQAELAGGEVTAAYVAEITVEEVEEDQDEDPYAKYYEQDDEDEADER
ncbi:MAG: DUF3073 domain-containing protein [Actinomycetota bacterium]|nr:DUF3073 domain-containing protein [Actinomycetota bacterium]MDP2289243.1 DUF3073 domain-containing protein [Actinomycetota bacterium]